MTIFEKGECFRGFLILIAQDRKIADEEEALLLRVGGILGLNRRFCENSIDDLLENRHIITSPPQLSRPEFVVAFLKDAVRIALADDEVHPRELEWLAAVAEKNGLTREWVEAEARARREDPSPTEGFHTRSFI